MKKIKGLGDAVKIVTDSLGIPQCEACKQRQKRLNDLFPFYKQSLEPTQEEIEFINSLEGKLDLSKEEVNLIYQTYNRLFGEDLQVCLGCINSIKKVINRLIAYKNHYNEINS